MDEFSLTYDIGWVCDDKGQVNVCCCCPELTHDETMKLRLLYKDDNEDYGNIVLFGDIPEGKVKQVNKNTFLESKFKDCVTIGKNKVIHQVFNAFTSEGLRIAYLAGESGMGKSQLSKHIANYMLERHKISDCKYINMDKTSNINVFLSRIPDYNLMVSFDKGGKVSFDYLIILDNMESLLINHFKSFRSHMQELIEQTRLRFIVITKDTSFSREYTLQWQERIIQIPPLNTQVAAKLLKQMANDHLPFNMRNIFELQRHEIFKIIKLSPQLISSIAFMLKKGDKSLDQICEDQEQKLNKDLKSQMIQDQSMQEIKNYLLKLKKESRNVYQLFLYVYHFSQGILLKDLEDSVHTVGISEDWLAEILYICVNAQCGKTDGEISKFYSMENIKNELLEEKNEGKTDIEIVLGFMKNEQFITNDLLQFTDLKASIKNEVSIRVSDPVEKLICQIEENSPENIVEEKVRTLEYFKFLYWSLMEKNREKNYYMENLMENTLLNSNQNTWNLKDKRNYTHGSYILKIQTHADLNEIIKFHEVNVRFLLSGSETKSISYAISKLAANSHEEQTFLNLMQDFSMLLMTVCMINEAHEEALEFTSLIRQINCTEHLQTKLKEFELKYELYTASTLFLKLSKNRYTKPELINQLEVQCKVIEGLLHQSQSYEWVNLASEFHITKYLILNSDKIRYKNKDSESLKTAEINKIMHELASIYSSIEDTKIESSFIKAKVFYVLFEHKFERKTFAESDLVPLKNASRKFAEFHSPRLECKTLMLLAQVYANHYQESLELSKNALKIAKKHEFKELEKDLKVLITNSNSQIRYSFQNKFYFLTSSPLRDQPCPRFGGLDFSINMRDLLVMMKGLEKHILVHFDVLKPVILKELFTKNQGCKLLVIDFLFLQDECIIIEEDGFRSRTMTLQEVEGYLDQGNNDRKINIDIMVLLHDIGQNKNKQMLIEGFSKLTQIPVTIYFDFQKPEMNKYDILSKTLKFDYTKNFLRNFIVELSKGHKVNDCIENARIETYESIYHNLNKENELIEVTSDSGELKASKIEKNVAWTTSILDEFFKDAVKVFNPTKNISIVANLSKGSLEETSPFGLREMLGSSVRFVRRDDLIVNLFDSISSNTFVNLHGVKGSGKTLFLQHFYNEVLLRNKFSDGVFWLKFKDIKEVCRSSDNIKELLMNTFGDRIEHNMNEYFQDSKKLIVIDDFHKILGQTRFRYPTFFMRALKTYKIATIVSSEYPLERVEELDELTHIGLPPLSKEQAVAYLLSLQKSHSFRFTPPMNFALLEDCRLLRKAAGHPAAIKNNAAEFLTATLSMDKKKGKKNRNDNEEIKELDESTEVFYENDRSTSKSFTSSLVGNKSKRSRGERERREKRGKRERKVKYDYND